MAEAGHYGAEQDPTPALALVHAGPSHEMQVAGPEPLVHGHPTESHPDDPLPTTLLPPALTLQKRDKGVRYQRGAEGLE